MVPGGASDCWPPKDGGSKGASPNLEKVGPGRVGPRKAEGCGEAKFLAFFFSRHFFHSFSLEVVSLNFGGVIEGRDPQMCTFGFSSSRVKLGRRLSVANTLCSKFTPIVVHLAMMDPKEMYFKRQVGEQRGVHAINNALGGHVFLVGDMLGVAAEIINRHNACEEF